MVMIGLFNRSTDQFKIFSCLLQMSKVDTCLRWQTREIDTAFSETWPIIKFGIGIWSILDTVFRCFPIFLTVLRYWVPPNVPLLNQKGQHMTLEVIVATEKFTNIALIMVWIIESDKSVSESKQDLFVAIARYRSSKLGEAISLGNRKVGSFCRYRHQKRIKGTEQ